MKREVKVLVNSLKKRNMLSVWELIDEIDILEKLMAQRRQDRNFECYYLDDFEKKVNRSDYIIVGAGKDGHAMIRLLNLLDKKISAWCDSSSGKIGTLSEKHIIQSTEKILESYNGEIILIASRQYGLEILEQILNFEKVEKKMIFDFDSIYAGGKHKKEYKRQTVLSYPPLWMTICVTSACPNKCLFCSYHGEAANGVSNVYGLPYMLSYKDFCRMVDMAKEGGVPRIHICGTGEPFINPEIFKMIDYVIEQYGRVSLQTDFWKELFQKKNYLDEIIKRERYISYIATDILSSEEKEHNKIKQGMTYAELLEALEYLGANSNVRIRAVNILTKKNYKHLKGIIDDLDSRNVNFELMITNLLSYDYSEFTASSNVYTSADKEITKMLEDVEEYAKGKDIKVSIPRPADGEGDCFVFWDTFQTWPVRGCQKERYVENMIPHACAAVVRGELNSLGYLFDYENIMDAWNNPKLVKIREDMINGTYPSEWCRNCFLYHGQDSYFNKGQSLCVVS
ncbi:MAG: radical SAM protein [Clostridiales bacterium]|nr:radical SAM protein [Clostridiales bacterium]